MKQGCFPTARLAIACLFAFSCGSRDQGQSDFGASRRERFSESRVFSENGKTFAPIDIRSIQLKTEFSPREKTARSLATVDFRADRSGYGYFLMTPEWSAAFFDGEPAPILTRKDPDGENIIRVIDRELREGEDYRLTIEYGIPAKHVTYSNDGVRFFTSMSDISSGNFLEAFAPANFETDAFRLEWDLSVEGGPGQHLLFANGRKTQGPDGSWKVRYPESYVSSSFFLHLTDAPLFVKESTYQGISAPIPITVYSQDEALAAKAIAALPGLFSELELTYGAYAHESFLAYMAGSGGMEYCGATITSFGALDHELTHSWFARGVMPSDGRSGWIDEAIASWRDFGYFRAESVGARPSTNLGRFSPFKRFAPRNSYVDGRHLLAEVDLLLAQKGGLRPVLRELFAIWQRKNIHTADFKTLLEKHTGSDLSPLFRHYVYGDTPSLVSASSEEIIQEKGRHPRPFTAEEIIQLR